MKRILLVIGIPALALIVFVFYTTPNSPVPKIAERPKIVTPTPFDNMLQEYEAYLQESLDDTGTPGAAVAVIRDSTIVFLKGFGVKDVENPEPVDVHTVFRLGSVSKPVAASLAGILVSDSLLHWNDLIVTYLDTLTLSDPEHLQQLTIKHVLSQSTGLPYHTYTNLIEDGAPLPVMLDELDKVDIIGKPGQVYSYQNVAYSIIDPVIEAATGHSFEDEIKSKLFGPLFMTDASVTFDGITYSANRAQPHLFRGRQWKPIPISNTYYNTAPAGGINASITDMAKWLVAMMGYRTHVIPTATIGQLLEPNVRATAKNRNFNRWSRIKKSYYGLGWRIINFKNDTIAYHGGYVNGFRSEVAIHPTQKVAICVLANGPSSFSDYAIPSFFILYDKYMREEQAPQKIAP